jgi:Flp pilus assembly pilin Flp
MVAPEIRSGATDFGGSTGRLRRGGCVTEGVTLGRRGASATEYTLIAAVIGGIVLIVLGRFGGSVGTRYSASTEEVERVRPGKVVKGEELFPQTARMPDGEALPGGPRSSGSSSGENPGRVGVGGLGFDLSTVIWLGVAIIVASAAMMTKVFRAARRPEPETQAERKDGSRE